MLYRKSHHVCIGGGLSSGPAPSPSPPSPRQHPNAFMINSVSGDCIAQAFFGILVGLAESPNSISIKYLDISTHMQRVRAMKNSRCKATCTMYSIDPQFPFFLSAFCRQGGREGDAAARDRLAEGAPRRHQAAGQRRPGRQRQRQRADRHRRRGRRRARERPRRRRRTRLGARQSGDRGKFPS